MRVAHASAGKWCVVDDEMGVVSVHDTNAQAWRALDKVENELRSRAEAVSDWIMSKDQSA